MYSKLLDRLQGDVNGLTEVIATKEEECRHWLMVDSKWLKRLQGDVNGLTEVIATQE